MTLVLQIAAGVVIGLLAWTLLTAAGHLLVELFDIGGGKVDHAARAAAAERQAAREAAEHEDYLDRLASPEQRERERREKELAEEIVARRRARGGRGEVTGER